METFGDWLKAELKQRGWKQIDLAHATGKPTATISRIITQQRLRPEYDTLEVIADALGYPVEEVYRHVTGLPGRRNEDVSAHVIRLFELVADWPEARQQALLEIAEVMERRLDIEGDGSQPTRVPAGRSAT